MNFNFIATYVDLQDIPSYTTNITVEGQLLKLSFMWNDRIGKRTLYITDSADQCYLQNTILHPNEPFELNANAVLNDLPYSVTLIKTGDQKRVGNIFNWSKDFILCFSRTVDVEVEKLNVVYGVTKPSTPTIPPIIYDDATNISGCVVWQGGEIDLEVNGVKVLSNANETELETYLFNNTDIVNDLSQVCGCWSYIRDVELPYARYEQGQTMFLPISLKPNGQPITSPFTVQGVSEGERAIFISETLNSQLEPYGLACVYGLFSRIGINVGVTYNKPKFNYEDTEFYILDEGNTFTSAEIPRGLPPYRCFTPF